MTANLVDPFTELVITQKLQHDEVMKEIAGVKYDIKQVADGVTAQLAEHNIRIVALETFKQTKAADDKIAFWNDSAIWVDHYRTRWKWIAAMVSFGSVVATFILDHILPGIRLK